MVLDANGRVGSSIALPDTIAKMGSGRRIPMHPDLRTALTQLAAPTARIGPVVTSAKGGHLRPNSIVNWFTALFAEVGAAGCSSHSGRRTFITNAARKAHRSGATLRDVQLLAGHKSIEVTQRYIDGDSDAQRRLVHSL
ncbi:integrase/recombinase XerD [Brevundimonas alba]|uniref:Integrase/recombinase XerD n=2 Tax=Brevundimonas alba TaxID=74314 RepID=A0A7X5YJC7_9CAUL|nr:integrase/recombinase XerD [Brevundimonas alba]